tara:strand:+ start:6782 stop:6931 length:150 start_codon:yes stop_codon:yes gene_type:complete
MIHHFKGIKQEMPEENKLEFSKKKKEIKKKYNKALYWAVIEEIREFINR